MLRNFEAKKIISVPHTFLDRGQEAVSMEYL